MLPDIGLMVGIYVITRAMSFLTRKGDRAEGTAVHLLSIITIIVAVITMLDLLFRGSSIPSGLR
jgi:hypothetical protein